MAETLVEMLQRGESRERGYNDYNRYAPAVGGPGHARGHDREINLSQMTLGEIQDNQRLPWDHPDKLHAVGRYQIIRPTLKEAMERLNLSRDERFTSDLQDRILVDYLMRDKPGRQAIGDYVTGKEGATLRAAQIAMAREWASVAHPDTGGSLYENNHATITPTQSTEALLFAREQYTAAIARNMSPDDAWRSATGLGQAPTQARVQVPAQAITQNPAPGQSQNDPVVSALQGNLNALGIRDAGGQPLQIDGNRGGARSHTNEAIAGFQRQIGLTGQLSNAELLAATQAVLSTRQALDVGQAVREVLPESIRAPRMVNGAPDYLVSGQTIANQAAPAQSAPTGRYTITESVGNRREQVLSFEDLEKHHPSAGREPGRQYQTINGELEEVRVRNGVTFVKKDFILSQDTPGPVNIPSPASGYVHQLNDGTNTVRIYDKPYGTEGAVMLAQSLHMERGTSPAEGTYVRYGQSIGQMGDTGSPGSVHAHIEAPVETYQRYVRDIANGTIQPGMANGVQQPSASEEALSNGTLQYGQSGPQVRALQEQLILLGATDKNGDLLKPDTHYGDRTKEAVEQFQLWTGRETTGIADPDTLKALQAQAQFAERQKAQGIDPGQRHLADNLKPAAPDLASAADVRTPQDYTASQNPSALEQGRATAAVQSGLIQLGYHHRISQPLTVNGVNDDATQQAVTAFQAQHNLPISGQADQATQLALQQALLTQQQAAEPQQAEDRKKEAQAKEEAREQARAEDLRFSHPDSPHHALYKDLEQRAEARGISLSEAQLTQATALAANEGIQAGFEGGVALRGDGVFFVRQYMPPAQFGMDTRQPAPPVEETVQQAAVQQREFAEEIARIEAQPKMQGPTLGPDGPGGDGGGGGGGDGGGGGGG